ncbi:MAG: glycosyltransferase family 4 protein [Armatimonadota bacterium]
MLVALDCRTVTSPKTGDRTYALNLSRALAEVDTEHEYLLYTWEPTTLTKLEQPNFRPVVLPAVPRWTWTPFVFPRDLWRRRVSLAHVQYLVPPVTHCPVVTTIHDIAFRRFPELFPLKHRLLLNALIPRSARHAAAVITGSEATRRDLLELYDLPPEQVFVTPYGVDPVYSPGDREAARAAVRRRLRIPVPYILAVGVLQPRKNLPRLVRAYNRIARHIPHRLVLAGKEGWAPDELREAVDEAPPGKDPIFAGYVADADLPDLYRGADLFAYPSLYEGFGLPPLEAMACGTPVLTSNTSSLPEVVGEAAITVDPRDTNAIADGMRRLLEQEPLRARLSAAGLRRAGEFDWRRTARETVRVYEEVLRRGSGISQP